MQVVWSVFTREQIADILNELYDVRLMLTRKYNSTWTVFKKACKKKAKYLQYIESVDSIIVTCRTLLDVIGMQEKCSGYSFKSVDIELNSNLRDDFWKLVFNFVDKESQTININSTEYEGVVVNEYIDFSVIDKKLVNSINSLSKDNLMNRILLNIRCIIDTKERTA